MLTLTCLLIAVSTSGASMPELANGPSVPGITSGFDLASGYVYAPSFTNAPSYAYTPEGADRPGFSYTYAELNYILLDSDAADDNINGGELAGSLELPLNLFIQAGVSTLSGDADLEEYRLGAGWHFGLGQLIDAFGILSFVDHNYDSGISDESGVTADAGVRFALTPKIELTGYGEWADVEDSEVGLGLGGRFYLTERLSLGLRTLIIDSGNEWVGGVRFQF